MHNMYILYMYICIYVCIHVYVCIYMYIRICVIYVHVKICGYIVEPELKGSEENWDKNDGPRTSTTPISGCALCNLEPQGNW